MLKLKMISIGSGNIGDHLKTAYQTSPFFEFYEDDIAPLYHQKETYLMEFNYKCLELISDLLQLEIRFKKTSEYVREPLDLRDRRDLINAKVATQTPPYNQVFQEKKGFIPNLCMLDLLFNEGPNSVSYITNLSPREEG